MPENSISAAAVAAVPEDHRWCIRCLGWFVGKNKTVVECSDPNFRCDHDNPAGEGTRCARCRSTPARHPCLMIVDSHWNLAREIIARRRSMIEFEKVNPHGGVTTADRTALNDSYKEVQKATQKHYKLLEAIEKGQTESVDSREPLEDQEYTDLGRPKRKAAKDHHWDWSLHVDDHEDYQPDPTFESGKRNKAQAEDNKTTFNLSAPVGTKEVPASSQQSALFRQLGLSHHTTPAPVPNIGFTAVNQERTLPGQATSFSTNSFAAVNQERAAPSAVAIASSVPGKQKPSFSEYYANRYPQSKKVGGVGQNNTNDSEEEVHGSFVAPVADMGRVNTPVRHAAEGAFPDVFATPAIPATPRASTNPAVPALAAGVSATIAKLAEEVARQTAAREDAVRQLGEAVFDAIATRGPGGVRLQDSEVADMLQILRQASQQ